MRNVLQIIHDLDYGGMQQVVVDLCHGLSKQRFRTAVCCLDATGPHAKELMTAGFAVHLLKKKPGIDISLIWRLAKLIRSQRIDIVHTHGINPFFYGTLAGLMAAKPVMVQTDHARGTFPVARKEMLSEKVLSYAVDRIVAVSEGVKQDLVTYEHIAPAKIDVITNGIDPSKYQAAVDPARKRQELGLAPEDQVVGLGVRLSPQKGIRYLIDAFSRLTKRTSNTKLLIIGDGELRPALERQARGLGLGKQVIFGGYRNDIAEILPAIDIYVLPSLWEGHPLVLLEAMAARRPVIASDIPGNRETVVDGKTGLLVAPENAEALTHAIDTLIADPELRRRMGANGYQHLLANHTLEQTINRYAELFSELTK